MVIRMLLRTEYSISISIVIRIGHSIAKVSVIRNSIILTISTCVDLEADH